MIVITGQTGTGKTTRALQIAKEINGALISADSRQVYEEMDLGTGKIDSQDDLTYKNDTWYLKTVPIFGINLITPNQIFSAGDFADYGRKIIKKLEEEGKTPIIVGGTGFYIKSLLDPDDTVSVPQNSELRKILETKPVPELQKLLQEADPQKLETMNNSDRNNPRRLVRALEVAKWKKESTATPDQTPLSQPTDTWIGLRAPREILDKRITARIETMLHNGLENEVRQIAEKYGITSPGMQTIGYREWIPYLDGSKSIEETKADIISAHLQYARKQMVYFRRFQFLKWEDITS